MLVTLMEPKSVEVPHEPGNHFSIRPLSARELGICEGQAAREMIDNIGADVLETMQRLRPQGGGNGADDDMARLLQQTREERRQDPLQVYSPSKIVQFGLVRWEGPAYSKNGAPITCNDAEKANLDKLTMEWCARQILDISEIDEGEGMSSGRGTEVSASEPTDHNIPS